MIGSYQQTACRVKKNDDDNNDNNNHYLVSMRDVGLLQITNADCFSCRFEMSLWRECVHVIHKCRYMCNMGINIYFDSLYQVGILNDRY